MACHSLARQRPYLVFGREHTERVERLVGTEAERLTARRPGASFVGRRGVPDRAGVSRRIEPAKRLRQRVAPRTTAGCAYRRRAIGLVRLAR